MNELENNPTEESEKVDNVDETKTQVEQETKSESKGKNKTKGKRSGKVSKGDENQESPASRNESGVDEDRSSGGSTSQVAEHVISVVEGAVLGVKSEDDTPEPPDTPKPKKSLKDAEMDIIRWRRLGRR